MTEIWWAADRLGRPVALTEAGWAHIMARRPVMAGREHDVRLVVAFAERVMRDADHPDRESHYRRGDDGLYLKVCVGYDATGSGTVITAHPTQRIKPRELHQRWP